MAKGIGSYIRKSVLTHMDLNKSERCVYCNTKTDILHRDHIVPPMIGGDSSLKNMTWACISCNSSKCNSSMLEWEIRVGIKRDVLHKKIIKHINRAFKNKKRGNDYSYNLRFIKKHRPEYSRYCNIIGVIKNKNYKIYG